MHHNFGQKYPKTDTVKWGPEKGDNVFGLFATFVQQKNEFKFLDIFCKMCQHGPTRWLPDDWEW